jgi:hypothetical protein
MPDVSLGEWLICKERIMSIRTITGMDDGESGWTGFDESAPSYTTANIETDRARYLNRFPYC